MASGTRSGKQPVSAAPDDGNSQDITTASPNQQLAIRAFSPEQDAALDQRFNDINASIIATNAKFDNMMRMLEQIQRQTTSSPILPSIETSPPAPPAAAAPAPPAASPAAPSPAPPAPPLPTSSWSPYRRMLRAEDIGFFDPEFQASEQEHGKTTPGPVVNAGKHAYYLDIFVFVDHLNELSRKYGQDLVKDVIPSCL